MAMLKVLGLLVLNIFLSLLPSFQSRTDRVVFKLFGKEPNDVPIVLRAQVLASKLVMQLLLFSHNESIFT